MSENIWLTRLCADGYILVDDDENSWIVCWLIGSESNTIEWLKCMTLGSFTY